MKRISTYFVLVFVASLLMASCQQEQLSVTDQQQDENIIEDANLVMMVMGITSHDGSHDDIVDNASCFSIDFPYQLKVSGEILEISNANDLNGVYDDDEVEPIYPLQITFADYRKTEVRNQAEMNQLTSGCSSGSYFNNSITCIDIVYPITIAEYNPATSDFQTTVYDHDRRTFTGISRMVDEAAVSQIKFPIQINVIGGETLQIDSNEQLKAVISSNIDFCF